MKEIQILGKLSKKIGKIQALEFDMLGGWDPRTSLGWGPSPFIAAIYLGHLEGVPQAYF